MTPLDVLATIRVVPVVEIDDAASAVPLALALLAGGLGAVEITLRTSAGLEAIEAVSRDVPDMLVGAGTVLDANGAEKAVAAGAAFLVSPGFSLRTSAAAAGLGVPLIPGAVTATEVMAAIDAGHRTLKFFPAAASGGLPALRALAAPFAHARTAVHADGRHPARLARRLLGRAVRRRGRRHLDRKPRGHRCRALERYRSLRAQRDASRACNHSTDGGPHMTKTMTAATLEPAERPTFYFIGVTTGQSSIRRVFPAWAETLGLGDVEMRGIDLPLHAPAADYRATVSFLTDDPLSLGALVTTHKIDMYRAAHDRFDEVSPLAELMGELSCITKRDGRLVASAKDPYSAGHAIDAILPPGHFHEHPAAEVFLMGAGGSSIAIDWYLGRPERHSDRPARVTVSNRSRPRLDALREVHDRAGDHVPLRPVLAPTASENDAVLTALPPHSFVVNATGLGKDAPGSPLSEAGEFPNGGYAWDLNYRGDLLFLDQARSQERERDLHVEDGWVYFLHGWTQVIGDVFGVDIPTSGTRFDALSQIAAQYR